MQEYDEKYYQEEALRRYNLESGTDEIKDSNILLQGDEQKLKIKNIFNKIFGIQPFVRRNIIQISPSSTQEKLLSAQETNKRNQKAFLEARSELSQICKEIIQEFSN